MSATGARPTAEAFSTTRKATGRTGKVTSLDGVKLTSPRGVREAVKLRLVAASAGRCEFLGCNRPLFEHPLTQEEGNFGQRAHIYAFSDRGPRGRGDRPSDIHSFHNLILLCFDCHQLVDGQATIDNYSVDTLRAFKAKHERRIAEATSAGPELRTTIIQLRGTIGGHHVDIPAPDVREAVAPRYVSDHRGIVIDLTSIATEGPTSFEIARRLIKSRLRECMHGGIDGLKVRHFSVFALAPIPLLISFGRELGDKLSIDLYRRSKVTQSWKWDKDSKPVEYEFRRVRSGSNPLAVALVLSLSGQILPTTLPAEIGPDHHLYEIRLKGQEPSREFLRTREDLVAFERTYRQALATITCDHDQLEDLHLFPAVPAPIAIACGREVLPKAHPNLVIYDYVKGQFTYSITINTQQDLP